MKTIKSAVAAILSVCLVFGACASAITVAGLPFQSIGDDTVKNTSSDSGEYSSEVNSLPNSLLTAQQNSFDESSGDSETNGLLNKADSADEPTQNNTVLSESTTNAENSSADADGETLLQNDENEPQILSPVPGAADKTPVMSLSGNITDENSPLFGYINKKEVTAALGSEYNGMLQTASDMHIYNFSVTTRGYISYTLNHESISDLSSFKAYLFAQYSTDGSGSNLDWRLMNVLNTTQNTLSDASAKIGVMPGIYRVVIIGGNIFPEHIYALTVNFTTDFSYEIECNDEMSRYTDIASGTPVKGSASYFDDEKDSDWFMLNCYTSGYISLVFEHDKAEVTSAFFKVSVYDINGNELYSANSFGSTVKLEGLVGAAPGCYFVEVRNIVYTSLQYTLTLKRTAQQSFESEPNNSVLTANKLTLGADFSASLSSHSSDTDIDYFEFTLSQNGYVVVNFAHTADQIVDENDDLKDGWRIKLTDKNGNLLWTKNSQWTDSGKESPNIGLAAGTYYISVDSNGLYFDARIYSVSVKFTATNDWEKEYNNTAKLANPVIMNYSYSAALTETGTDYDTDWFSFTLNSDSRICLSLTHEYAITDKSIFAMSLYSDENTRCSIEDISGNKLKDTMGNDVTITISRMNTTSVSAYYTLKAGTYYMKVTSGTYFSNMRYNIVFGNT